MNDVIIGNAFSLCAMVTDSISGTRKKKSEILGWQLISQFFYTACSIVLKGYSSAVQDAVAILRNLVGMKDLNNKYVEWTLILTAVVLGFVFNNRGYLGWLPVFANLEYSIAIFRFKDNEKALKIAFIINMALYAVFCYVILNYVGTIANIIVVISTAVSLLKESKA